MAKCMGFSGLGGGVIAEDELLESCGNRGRAEEGTEMSCFVKGTGL